MPGDLFVRQPFREQLERPQPAGGEMGPDEAFRNAYSHVRRDIALLIDKQFPRLRSSFPSLVSLVMYP